MNGFTLFFLAALALGVAVQLWLALRQARAVKENRDRVPLAFARKISLPDHPKAADYTLARLAAGHWQTLLFPVVLLGWTLGGGLDWLAQVVLALHLAPLWTGALIVMAVLFINGLIDLPLQIWSTFGIEQRFGFNRTTVGRFLRDKLLQTALLLLLGAPLLLAVLWLMASAGNHWWFAVWCLWMGFSLVMTWVYPIWIAPLFNRFEPLPEGALKSRLEALLKRCGFASRGMYVMDGSTRSGHGNAYFTGFGRNKRIVFYDTLLDGLDDTQVEAVLAHELGHFRRRHVIKLLALSALLSLAGLALLGWLIDQDWFYTGLGLGSQSPAIGLALFLLVLPVFSVFLTPLLSLLSRRYEYEADAFAAQYASAQALVDGLLAMYRDNASTLTPDRLYAAFHHSHPAAAERIAHLLGGDKPFADTHPSPN